MKMTKKKVKNIQGFNKVVDYERKIHEYRSLLQFTCSFDNYSTAKELFGAFDRFLKREFKTGPLVVLSLPIAKFDLKNGDYLKISRNIWNKKTLNSVYSHEIVTLLMNTFLEKNCDERNFIRVVPVLLLEMSGDRERIFEIMNCATVDEQIFIAFFEVTDDFDEDFMEPIVHFLSNSTTRLKKWKELEKLESLIYLDDVTGLYNQRKLYKDLDNCIHRYKDIQEKFSVLFIDIDHFKKVNDEHGHLIGTQILKEVAGVLNNVLRETDLCYRYGGDEFVAIVPDSNGANTYNIGLRILKALEVREFELNKQDGQKIKLTVSIGVANFPDDASSKEEILEKADQMMYAAKESGRGRVCKV